MQVLFVFSRLLDYPDQGLYQDRALFDELIDESPLQTLSKKRLNSFFDKYLTMDLMSWQAQYDGLFERGRSLGLWLFEHVHGESRDRGQAMVELLANYRAAGLEINQQELPDYIPLFLEFLVTQGEDNAREWLIQVEHILALIMCRLEQRESDYAALFELLLELADSDLDLDALRQQLAGEKRDDTAEALDKEWEEEVVTFGADTGGGGCSSQTEGGETVREVPVTWMDFDQTRRHSPPDRG
ncbi:nitrate reductase molybdenum cofactor assembly chaperone [Methylophaga sp. OBS4]|uniref:nitrate reductase molybdenum cofactor assembly chaperone n=1 Tax=Methylophaga sp. OBS4 TaxID=2991935 RepID=UPI0022535E30|nr:nitrate reductase molybdenum cofactor assembly chaperone [Methylophaga sp. OBS4]MCX4188527.1 nitrate reductase molybdenum cofactor assembly chaperone [Methylophaga sp. OBS4]